MHTRRFALLCLPLFVVLGCGENRDAKQKAAEAKDKVAVAPQPKKPAEPDPEAELKLKQDAEAKQLALKEKQAAAKNKALALEKIKAAEDAKAKVKKQLDDSRKAILDSPERTANLRKYREQLDKVKDGNDEVKSLKMRINEIEAAGNPAGMQLIRADLEDQLKELVRQLPEAARMARVFAARVRMGIPMELQLSEDELKSLALSLRGP